MRESEREREREISEFQHITGKLATRTKTYNQRPQRKLKSDLRQQKINFYENRTERKHWFRQQIRECKKESESESESEDTFEYAEEAGVEDDTNDTPKICKGFLCAPLSDLPEPLISQILGFLTTTDAVRTSILSSEWKHRWTSIANLDIDDGLLNLTKTSFENFIYQVMLQLKFPLLHKFRLRCGHDHEFSIINEWICAALLRGVKEMDIDIIRAETRSLPCGLFKCHTLAVLKLCVCTLDVPVSVQLPNLKVFHLRHAKLKDKSISKFFSSCPVLEDLALLSCWLEEKYVLNISNPALKKLVLKPNGDCKVRYTFVLDAPNLEYLEFAGYIPQRCTVKKLHSLVEARVEFKTHCGGVSPENLALKNSVTEFVYALSNVRSLHLSNYITKAFSHLKIQFPVFPKLTKLEHVIEEQLVCTLLQDLLKHLPQLDTVALNFNNHFVPREHIPAGIWDQLKVVKRTAYEGDEEDLKFVKYILRNADVLERFNLHPKLKMTTKQYVTLTNKLSSFRRASSSCKIVVYPV